VTLEEVQRAAELLKPHFEQIEVLCSLRPQIDLAVSFASNVAKARERVTRAYFEKVRPDSSYYNYESLVEKWSTAFGAEKLSLVPFRRTPDFADVVAARAGINTADLQPPVRSNEALDVRVMAMTNAMKVQPLAGRWIEPFAHIPLDVLHLLPCEERLQPGLELARSVQTRFEESNHDLTNGRTDVEMADLEPDWNRYDAPSNLDVLEQPCAFSREFAALVQIFNQNIALARAQNEVAQAERHLESRHPLIAQRRLKTTLRLLALLKQAEISSHRIRRLQARTAALARELEGSPDHPSKGRRRAGKPRRGRRRADANGQSRASEASADEQDLS
jgi:hypothetical protein